MAIKDLNKYRTLVNAWKDVINSAAQSDFWVKNMLTKISTVQNDPNFSNADQDEINYLNSWIIVLNKFVSDEPINPDPNSAL